MEIDEMARRIESLEASRVGLTILLTALMRHFPDPLQMQLFATSLLEQQLATGALGSTLTGDQKEACRELVEWAQAHATKKEGPAHPSLA